jgi:outer membrane protein
MKRHLLAYALALSVSSVAVLGYDTQAPNLPAPLDLKSAVRYALDHNYAILQAREAIRFQEGVIVQVKSAAIPNVAAQGQWQRNDADISQTFPQETSFWNVTLSATQTLYAGGGVVSAIKAARLDRDAAAYDLQTAIDTALLDVRTKFFNVILAREKIRVDEENVRLYQHQLEDTKNQFQAGSVSNFEVLRAKVYLANAEPALITARNDYRIAIEQLRQSLGVPTSTAFPEVAGDLSFTPETYETDAAIASAHEHRPELEKLEKLQEAGEEMVTNATTSGTATPSWTRAAAPT